MIRSNTLLSYLLLSRIAFGAGAEPVVDLYSVGADANVATVDGEPVTWSDFARYALRSWGTVSCNNHFGQLSYTEILRQELAKDGLVVTQADLEDELHRAWQNSIRSDSRMQGVDTLEKYVQRIKVQTGKGREAYMAFLWGFAAQSKLILHRYPEVVRRELYQQGEIPTLQPSYTIAHVLAQTLAGRRTDEEARERIASVKARLEAGEDWNTVCYEFSDDVRSLAEPSTRGADGTPVLGSVGPFRLSDCPFGAAMAAALRGLQAEGEPESPAGLTEVETEFGHHLVRVVEVREVAPFEEVDYQIIGHLTSQFMREQREAAEEERLILSPDDWYVSAGFPHEDLVAARLNGVDLQLSDFGRMIYLNAGPREGGSFLQRMLEDFALELAARELGITVSPEEVEASLLAEYEEARSLGRAPAGGVEAWLESQQRRSRSSPRQYREHRRVYLLRDKTRDVLASEERCRQFYEAHPDQFTAEYRTRCLFIYHHGGRAGRTEDEARALAEQAREVLDRMRSSLPDERRGHEDEDYFGLLVDQWNEDPRYGRTRGVTPPFRLGVGSRPGTSGRGVEFEQTVALVGVGEAGLAPVRGGFAVFEVLEAHPAPTFEEVLPKLRERLKQQAARLQLDRRVCLREPNLLGISE